MSKKILATPFSHEIQTLSPEVINFLNQCVASDDDTTYCYRCKFLGVVGKYSLVEEKHKHPLTLDIFRLCKKCGDTFRGLK